MIHTRELSWGSAGQWVVGVVLMDVCMTVALNLRLTCHHHSQHHPLHHVIEVDALQVGGAFSLLDLHVTVCY